MVFWGRPALTAMGETLGRRWEARLGGGMKGVVEAEMGDLGPC